MYIKLRQWIKEWKLHQLIEKQAKVAFQQNYPSRKLSTFPRLVEQTHDSLYVVTLGYDNTRPPQRSWWKVDTKTKTVSELSYDEASKYIKHPKIWR